MISVYIDGIVSINMMKRHGTGAKWVKLRVNF